jgi:hypothetical protein
MTQDQVIQMLKKVVAENQNYTTWTVSTPHLVALVHHAMAQRTWIDMTDTQIENVYFEVVKEHRGAPMPWGQVQFGRAVLEKFKEKNT